MDAAGHLGNGVYLMNMSSGDTRALNSSALEYDQLAWSDEGGNLAVLRGEKAKDMKQRDNALLAWTGAGTPNAKEYVLDPSKDASFPKGMVLSEYTAPRWSKDGSRIFLGVKDQEPEIAAADSIKANVDVWHWKDPEPQIGADGAPAAGAARDAARRLSRRRAEVRAARRRRHAHRHADAERQVGDRPERRRVPRPGANGARAAPTCTA